MPGSTPAKQEAHGQPGATTHTNRLIDETSPYLLQHAHNPVDWYPWGPEAFEAARQQDKPIFLSVGYSTCYWCHVMERESFENEEIAAIMNANFICIKVDREERPDVDDIYMAAVQALTGRGGWPMSVFLEPTNLKPFFGGTYFPAEDVGQRPGFRNMLLQLVEVWKTRRPDIMAQAMQVSDFVAQRLAQQAQPVAFDSNSPQLAVSTIVSTYDPVNGGYGPAPKFPMAVNLDFLIRVGFDKPNVRDSLIHTLDAMATGGMYDQIGGGFHRYSTDALWLVPHFEKMLYDNGQLATTYALAYERTQDPFYGEIIRELLDYVLREMTGEQGGFHSAQDAEVDAREGLNYIWTREEMTAALDESGLGDDVEFALKVYAIDREPNFRDPHHPEDGPKYVVHLIDRPGKLAASMDIEPAAFNERLARVNAALLVVRDRRKQPRLDDKIIAGFNGLMIGGFAHGGRVLDEPRYVAAAARAADFVLTTMRTDDGGLLRTHRNGTSKIDAFAEDYGMLIGGLLALHGASGESRWLDEAQALADAARTRFWDETHGGYFDTLADQSDLFVRTKSQYDGAVPCANSTMLNNLLDLHEATGEPRYLEDAATVMKSMSPIIARAPQIPVLSTYALQRFVERYPESIGLPGKSVAEAAPTKPAVVGDEAVAITADMPSIALAPGDRITVVLSLEMKGAYHINAHEPGPEFLIPLTIELQDGEGFEIVIDYPEGEIYSAQAIAEEDMRVYKGRIDVPVRIERTGEVTGTPVLAITYQACTDSACLIPKTVIAPVTIKGK